MSPLAADRSDLRTEDWKELIPRLPVFWALRRKTIVSSSTTTSMEGRVRPWGWRAFRPSVM